MVTSLGCSVYTSPTFTGAAFTSWNNVWGPASASVISASVSASASPVWNSWGPFSSTPATSSASFSSIWAGPCSTVGSVASSIASAFGSDTSYSAGSTISLPYICAACFAPTRMGMSSPLAPVRTPMHTMGSPSCTWGSHSAGYWASTSGATGARYTCIRLDSSTGSSCSWPGFFSGFWAASGLSALGCSAASLSGCPDWAFSISFWKSLSPPLLPVLGSLVWDATA